ncbi:IS4 family transposase [Deltaproteobacteria bacterium]|nr:IS4 family transposase [Deltaproteobacteria bacterium]
MDPTRWSEQECGDAERGDARLNARLREIAVRVAESSGGSIAAVFRVPAERQAAYHFMSNARIDWEDVASVSHVACVRRCIGEEFVFVPEDGSSLNITDREHTKGTGPVGTRTAGARGFQVMNLIVVNRKGVPLGLCGQGWWSRPETAATKSNKARSTEEKETKHWGIEMATVRALFAEHASGTTPWFQLDRGGDAWPVLIEAMEQNQWVTIRSSSDRRLVDAADGGRRYLHETVAKAPILGGYSLDVKGGHGRTERVAKMIVRSARVTLHMLDDQTSQHHDVEVSCVWTVEIGTNPSGEKPLDWMLLTTRPVETFTDAKLTIYGYSLRWRIEEFHKAWKSGACNVEDMQLRSERAIRAWSTLLGADAMRLLRMTYLARAESSTPATEEFTMDEIHAVHLARSTTWDEKHVPNIGKLVGWIADIGGYTGKSSGGPPGILVLARGWERIAPIVPVVGRLRGIQPTRIGR